VLVNQYIVFSNLYIVLSSIYSIAKSICCIVTEYEFDLEAAEKELQITLFEKPDDAWLDFVSANRSGHIALIPYDIAIGPVANDAVYTTIMLYEQGILDKDATIKQLKVQKLFNQILFHTEKSLRFCRYCRHEAVGGK